MDGLMTQLPLADRSTARHRQRSGNLSRKSELSMCAVERADQALGGQDLIETSECQSS
jgi:hypothetical protein